MLFNKLFKKSEISDFRGYNYLDDSDINNYFKADEYFSYYNSLKTVAPRRDISEEIIYHNLPFLFSLNDERIGIKIDEVIRDSLFDQRVDTKFDINNSAKIINPNGFKLLNIKEALNLKYLKACYKIACKKHHPDVGGKNEDMQIINIAFGQFHNLLKTYQLADSIAEDRENILDDFDVYGEPIIKSLKEFRFFLANQLFSICIDIFCVDKGIEIFDHIHESLLINQKFRNYFFDNNIDNFDKLAIRLSKSDQMTHANRILKVLKDSCERQIKTGLSKDYFNKLYRSCENKLNGKENIRIIINHFVQAQHAYRLGIIDKKKYDKLVEKFKGKNEIENNIEKKLNEYAMNNGFIDNLGIYEISNGIPTKKLIPEPDYYHDRFNHLSEDQKIEYINAFRTPVRLALIKKYKEIRKTSYLLSLIKNYDKFHATKILEECKLLAEVLNDKSFLLIIDTYNFLSSIDSKERNKKLEYLNDMDYDDPPSLGISLKLDNDRIGGSETIFNKRISVREDYLEFMTATNDQLLKHKKTGEDPFNNTQDWNEDLIAINNLENSNIGAAYKEKWLGNEKDPHKLKWLFLI
ncbi:J domain-containing protein [candidate division KSB1 bacterium]|nr:J domain-containing protein [candidate division KSB1 bacterium]